MTIALNIRIELPGGTSMDARLHRSPAAVGRSASADVVLVDPKVSSRHAELAWGDQGITITDLKSRNGTIVEGVRIATCVVRAGTSVRMGDSTLTVLGMVVEAPKAAADVPIPPPPRRPKGGLSVGGVVVALTLSAAAILTATMLLNTQGSSRGSATRAIPSPQRVAALAQREIDREIESAESTASVESLPEDTLGMAVPDTLPAEFVREGEVRVVDQRVDAKDDSLVIVTFELTGPDLDAPLTWEACYRRTPGEAALTGMTLPAGLDASGMAPGP